MKQQTDFFKSTTPVEMFKGPRRARTFGRTIQLLDIWVDYIERASIGSKLAILIRTSYPPKVIVAEKIDAEYIRLTTTKVEDNHKWLR